MVLQLKTASIMRWISTKKRNDDYHRLQNQLDQTKEEQISTSIHASGHMVLRSNITKVTYNVQPTVDAQHYIPIDYEVTNRNDPQAMGAKSKGHPGEHLFYCTL